MRVHLLSDEVNVRNDQKCVTFLWLISICKRQTHSLTHSVLAIQVYLINFEQLERKNNEEVDFLIRNVQEFQSVKLESDISIMVFVMANPGKKLVNSFKSLQNLQKTDKQINKIYNNMRVECTCVTNYFRSVE